MSARVPRDEGIGATSLLFPRDFSSSRGSDLASKLIDRSVTRSRGPISAYLYRGNLRKTFDGFSYSGDSIGSAREQRRVIGNIGEPRFRGFRLEITIYIYICIYFISFYYCNVLMMLYY